MKSLNELFRLERAKLVAIAIFLVLFLFMPSIFARGSPPWQNIVFQTEMPKISMDFKEANLKDVLKIFSQQANLNFIASAAVEDRKITLYLKDVSVDEALEKLLAANNLTYEKEESSDIFIVKDKGGSEIDMVTKVFYLKYARVSNSRLSKEIEDKISSDEGGASASSTTGEDNITAAVKKVISTNGRVVEDTRTNSLIVTDIASRFTTIQETIARLDIPIPQVMIEIEMLDANQDVLDELGVKFSNTALKFTGPSQELRFPFGNDMKGNATRQTTHFGMLSAESLTATLQLLQTHTDTKYLARPRLLTLSNETSEIRITVDEAIGVTTETAAAGGSAGSITQTAERAETGILLRVTPQINTHSGEVTMFLETSVTQAKAGTITLQGNTLKDPESRATKSTVMVPDGETVVIGGLIRTDDSQVRKKVPILGDIPFLGAAFRHREGTTKNRELIIFITPHLLRTNAVAMSQVISEYTTLDREQGPLTSLNEEVNKALSEFEKSNNL
ncbi:MAG: secretin N-terminal domain-containing protein [Candidatus Omnitrophota bacterium]